MIHGPMAECGNGAQNAIMAADNSGSQLLTDTVQQLKSLHECCVNAFVSK